MGHQGDNGSVVTWSHPPQVEVGNAVVPVGLYLLLYLQRLVLPGVNIQQYRAGLLEKAMGPAYDHQGAHNAHDRVKPVPAVEFAGDQGDDGQKRR